MRKWIIVVLLLAGVGVAVAKELPSLRRELKLARM